MSAATTWDRAIGIRSFADVPEASAAHSAPHALAVLESAHGVPLTVGDFKRRGVALPARAIYQLLLVGHHVDPVHTRDDSGNVAVGYRLRPKSGSS